MRNVLLPVGILNKIALIVRSALSTSSKYTISEITSKILSLDYSRMIYNNSYISIYQHFIADGNFVKLYKSDDNSKVINFPSYGAYFCPSLTSISYSNCSSIGTHAFEYCTALEDAQFSRCQTIDSYAFASCSSLYTYSFPECTLIKEKAFKDCINLSEAVFPKCKEIASDAFIGCKFLERVYMPRMNKVPYKAFQQYHYLTEAILTECTLIDDYAFDYCDVLQDIQIPNCSFIGKYVFRSCALPFISLPNCHTIGEGAFYNCESLNKIILDSHLLIGNLAFAGCIALSEIRLMSNTPTQLLGQDVFKGTMFDKNNVSTSIGKLYVPYELYSYYREKWASFINIGTLAIIA